jgi:hypothetical protein
VNRFLFVTLLMVGILGCETPKEQPASIQQRGALQSPSSSAPSYYQACPERRPEACIEIFQPVCAERDTGIRCITANCQSTEKVEYANSCKACADKSVIGYSSDRCESEN